MSAPAAPRLHALTGLRFVAAAMIVVFHSRGHFGLPDQFAIQFAWTGAVSLFFVLSGFVLTHAHPTLDGPGAWRRFWCARFARIWPAHVATLVLLFVLLPTNEVDLTSRPSRWALAANLALVHGWFPSPRANFSYNTVSWSISTEWAFYLAFPLLLVRWERTWHWKLGAAFLLTAAILARSTLVPETGQQLAPWDARVASVVCVNPLTRLCEFALGMALAHAYRSFGTRVRVGRGMGTGLELAAVACAFASLSSNWRAASATRQSFGPCGLALETWLFGGGAALPGIAALIIVLSLQQGWVTYLLGLRPVVVLGEISYGLYLLHQPLLRFCYWQRDVVNRVPGPVAYALFWAACLAGSYVLWRCIETPARTFMLRRRVAVAKSEDAVAMRRAA